MLHIKLWWLNLKWYIPKNPHNLFFWLCKHNIVCGTRGVNSSHWILEHDKVIKFSYYRRYEANISCWCQRIAPQCDFLKQNHKWANGKWDHLFFFFTVHALLLNCQSKTVFRLQQLQSSEFTHLKMQSFEKIQDWNESPNCHAAILDSDFPAAPFPQYPC